jgi:hypothetical protein
MVNRYKNIETRTTEGGRGYRSNPIYPTITPTEDDIYVMTTVGDRYDTLALQFYKDSSLWWIIAAANNHQRASLVTTPGVQLRIPADKTHAIRLYNEVNSTR